MDEQQAYQELRKNLGNRTWRLNNLYYIKDKDGNKILLKLNWAQRVLLAAIWYFNLILKARQLGFTTFILIYFLDACLFNSNHSAGVIAHTKEAALDLFDNKVKFAYDNLPGFLRVAIPADTDSAKKLAFSNGSSLSVGTSLRSGTYQKLLISEYGKQSAKYPEKAREIKTGALNTVGIGQQIFVESTAEGKMGEFFDLCELARKLADSGKQLTRLEPKFFFFAWFDNPEYRLSDEETATTVIPQQLQDKLSALPVDRNQMAWYAAKAAVMQDDMRREYPSTPEEAFEGSLEGAYYTKEMAIVRKNGQICHVPYDRRYPVNTYWDIGQASDLMSILFYQDVGGRRNFIDYHESNDQGWDFYAKLLREKDYNYGRHEWPHDGNKRIVGERVQTSREIAQAVGIKPIYITPVTKSVWEDIRDYCKPVLPMCFFDAEKCAQIIEHLDNYRRRWDNINSMWLNDAVHDEASHGADAFRTYARAHKLARPEEPPPPAHIPTSMWEQ